MLFSSWAAFYPIPVYSVLTLALPVHRQLLSELLGGNGEEELKWLLGLIKGGRARGPTGRMLTGRDIKKKWKNLSLEKSFDRTKFMGNNREIFEYINFHDWEEKSLPLVSESFLDSQQPVYLSTLVLFLSNGILNRRAIPKHPDINRNRFTDITNKEVLAQAGNVKVVPYKEEEKSGEECPQNPYCDILPMTSKDTEEDQTDDCYAAVKVTKADVEKSFEAVFGHVPTLDDVSKTMVIGDYIILFLLQLQDHFQFESHASYGCLITALAMNIWKETKDEAIERIDSMQIPMNAVPAVAMLLFSIRIPIKLGFLLGETRAAVAHASILACKATEIKGQVAVGVVNFEEENAADAHNLPSSILKDFSNQANEQEGRNFEIGSMKDFLLEQAILAIHAGEDYWANANYNKRIRTSIQKALQAFKKASNHNPHLATIKSHWQETAKRSWDPTDDDEGFQQLGETLYNNRWLKEKTALRKINPVYIFWIISTLTNFTSDAKSAAALKSLIDHGESSNQVSFLIWF